MEENSSWNNEILVKGNIFVDFLQDKAACIYWYKNVSNVKRSHVRWYILLWHPLVHYISICLFIFTSNCFFFLFLFYMRWYKIIYIHTTFFNKQNRLTKHSHLRISFSFTSPQLDSKTNFNYSKTNNEIDRA